MSTQLEIGINVNSTPIVAPPFGRPHDASDLSGLKWIRCVFFLRGAIAEPSKENIWGYNYIQEPLNYHAALEKAFAYYDGLIEEYHQAGMKTLLVLIQDSFGGNVPWFPGSDGNWDKFAKDFGVFCGHIASHYKDKNVAYQIWNESDIPPHPDTSSIFIEAENYATVLKHASANIKQNDPNAQIILGGLATGAGNGVKYLQTIQNKLGGTLPVTAIGIHPYTLHPTHTPVPDLGLVNGRLDKESFDVYIESFPDTEFWLTEIGVAADTAFPEHLWNDIASYMRSTIELIRSQYADKIKKLMWWSWSDNMRHGGIVNHAGEKKQPIYSTLIELASETIIPAPSAERSTPDRQPETRHETASPDEPARPLTTETDTTESRERVFVTPIDDGVATRIRREAVNGEILAEVNHGTPLEIIEENIEGALAKIGVEPEWLEVRMSNGIEGFIAAWFVERFFPQQPDLNTPSESPTNIRLRSHTPTPHEPNTELDGEDRALDFFHDPEFVRIPVALEPEKIHSFNGFGPNNFAYNLRKNPDDFPFSYDSIWGIHNGLDFIVPDGTELCAADWGLVVHCSQRDGDAPFKAGPRTVAVVHGEYIAIYGHLTKSDIVSPGDIVQPGDVLAHSGMGHLHFELRDLTKTYRDTLTSAMKGTSKEQRRDWLLKNENLLNGANTTYINSARFFTKALDSYGWGPGMRLPIDTNNNGYPNNIELKGGERPFFDLNWLQSYSRGNQGNFWDGSKEV